MLFPSKRASPLKLLAIVFPSTFKGSITVLCRLISRSIYSPLLPVPPSNICSSLQDLFRFFPVTSNIFTCFFTVPYRVGDSSTILPPVPTILFLRSFQVPFSMLLLQFLSISSQIPPIDSLKEPFTQFLPGFLPVAHQFIETTYIFFELHSSQFRRSSLPSIFFPISDFVSFVFKFF